MHPRPWVARVALIATVGVAHLACARRSERGPTEPRPAERLPQVAAVAGPNLVPIELVAALIPGRGAPGEPAPEVVAGRLPESMPFDVPRPEGARVVGALVRRSSGTLVFATSQTPGEAVRGYEATLRAADWQQPVRGGRMGGFRPAEDLVYSGLYCQGERRSLSFSGIRRREGGSFLRVDYVVYERGSPCQDRRSGERPFARAPIPDFRAPAGVRTLEASAGGGRGYMEAQARVESDLRPAQLVAHYGEQARAQGWSPQSEATGPALYAQTFRMQDPEGRTWIGLLMAQAIPGSNDRVVTFRVIAQARDDSSPR